MKQIYLFKRLFASFVLLLMTTLSWAYDFEVDGICYNINSDGTSVTVTYKGTGDKYSGAVVIPETVTYSSKVYSVTIIGPNAFSDCPSLTSVTIPEGVKLIGGRAFSYCSSLASVTIPNSITQIEFDVFSGCESLKRVEFASVKSICNISYGTMSSNPLYYAKHLYIDGQEVTDLIIPNGVTSINSFAFVNCSNITSITIPSSVTFIGSGVLRGCDELSYISIDVNNPVYDSRNECNAIIEKSSDKLIVGCKNTFIPKSVTSIGGGAFSECKSLTSIKIPDNVTSIASYSFSNSGLMHLTIDGNTEDFRSQSFLGCPLRTIISKSTTPNRFPDIFDGAVYNHTTLYVPQNTYWDYVFNSEWYRFLHIKEFAADEVEARQAYMLADPDGTKFTVYNAASDKLVTKEYMHQVDETSPGSNWVAEPCGAGMALLNLGAEKYAQISSDGKISLSDTPQELDIEFNDGVATANGRQMMLVLNDDDDVTDVVTLRYTLSASEDSFDPNAPVYDLMGRRLQQKPVTGYYIQGGKKYFVK
ncbi:MAG: leucine-rich repeat domain-containing protein [Bacteroidaceae bacterium]|nr:leucine-rich repeat domain-containing protein [Bacteroidaceae bacterium]